jgi:hypothetical protein
LGLSVFDRVYKSDLLSVAVLEIFHFIFTKIFFTSPFRPDRLWGQHPISKSRGIVGDFPGGKAAWA